MAFAPRESDQQFFAYKVLGAWVSIEIRNPHLRNAPPEVQRTWRVDSIVAGVCHFFGAVKQPLEMSRAFGSFSERCELVAKTEALSISR